MKIAAVQTTVLSIPLPKPIEGGRFVIASADPILVQVRTDDGLVGFGYALTLNGHRARVVKAMAEDLAEIVTGEDAFYIHRIGQKMWQATESIGHRSVALHAMAAIDTALWDIVGQATGQPVYKLLGGCRDKVPAYASGGLWRSSSLDELPQEACRFVEQGFKALKMRVGKAGARGDVERVRVVREAIGDDIALMVDVNQAWTAAEAIRMGRLLEEYNIFWLEEPVPAEDVAASAQVAAALTVPVCAGENAYGKGGFRELIESRAADILMPDLQRAGGITQWMEIAALAQAWHLPVASHLFPEIQAHILAAVPNALTLEYMPWVEPLYSEVPRIVDGMLKVPQKPGLGLEISSEALARYRVG